MTRKPRRTVVVETPFRGTSPEDAERKLAYARAAVLDCLRRGEAAFASHLLYTQVLDDAKPEERAFGIEAGLDLALRLEATVVYTDLGISPGIEQGIQAAWDAGRPVEYRSLLGWE